MSGPFTPELQRRGMMAVQTPQSAVPPAQRAPSPAPGAQKGVTIVPGDPVPLASPPASSAAGAATPLYFTADIDQVIVANQGAVPLTLEWDGTVATPGSLIIRPGGAPAILDVHIPVSVGISLYTATAVAINGNVTPNILVKGIGGAS